MPSITYKIRPPLSNEAINQLFAAVWDDHETTDLQPILQRSLLWVCAYGGEQLVGYVNMAWDGGVHGFILDTAVHRDFRRRGIGVELVRRAVDAAREHGLHWIHVDYEPHLEGFYQQCGFRETKAGLIRLE